MSQIIAKLVAISILIKLSLSADPSCSNGIMGYYSSNTVCCVLSCGICQEDPDCSSRPGGSMNCCPLSIHYGGNQCTNNNAPCKGVTASTLEPTSPTPFPTVITSSPTKPPSEQPSDYPSELPTASPTAFPYSQWISPSAPKLPITLLEAGAGYYGDTIHIVGGINNEYGYIQYNMTNNSFSYHSSVFPTQLKGNSQWWFQIDNTMYLTYHGALHTYDLVDKQFNQDVSITPSNTQYNTEVIDSCLTGDSTHSVLYLIGGRIYSSTYLNVLQILNLSTMSWSTGPSLNTARSELTCAIAPNKHLYAIGGSLGANTRLATIEVLNTNNIQNSQWFYTNQSLSSGTRSCRSVILDHIIYVIEGFKFMVVHADPLPVHIINTQTNEVYVASERLAYPGVEMAVILIDHMIYGFGGYHITASEYEDSWQYMQINPWYPTSSPSPAPTTSPTIPTLDPTTHYPTLPTSYPTALPSLHPTAPSIPPTTYAPTPIPTMTPKTSCGTNCWHYDVYLFPEVGSETSKIVNVWSTSENVVEWHLITIRSIFNHCVNPIISVSFEEIDYTGSSAGEYFDVYDHDSNVIQRCTANEDYNCGVWESCMDSIPLGVDKIPMNDLYVMFIITGDGFNDLCTGTHLYTFNALVIITCSDESASPTSDPTSHPSIGPTQNPTTNQSATLSPTATSAPTTQPSQNITRFLAHNLTRNQWISPSTPKLPIANSHYAVAYFQNTIHIIGGWNQNEKSYLKYNVESNTFSDYDQSYFPAGLWGYGQWWHQMDDILYMLSRTSGTILHIFDLANQDFMSNVYGAPISQGSSLYSCLTGDSGLLYVIGGWNGTNRLGTLQIFNPIDMSWSRGPNINTARTSFSCVVSPNQQLYAIGGGDPNSIPTIEYIATNNITSNTWSYTQQTLSQALKYTRCVLIQDNIYVIGGYISSSIGHTDIVHVINTITNSVYVSPYRLSHTATATAPIVINQLLYVFGGYNGTTDIKKWQYIFMTPTTSPTIAPTLYPTTSYPTIAPTTDPTVDPTTDPTSDPTNDPTDSTADPTSDPTKEPTSSTSTTMNPTDAPINALSTQISCGVNQWCYHADLYPQIGTETSETVHIWSIIDSVAEDHIITFTSNYNHCVNPIISVLFEQIDYSGPSTKYFDVFDQDLNLVKQCIGNEDSDCGVWTSCIDSASLGIDKIAKDESYTMLIEAGPGFNALCSNSYTFNANVMITCSDQSSSGVPASQTTESPSAVPTASPLISDIVNTKIATDTSESESEWVSSLKNNTETAIYIVLGVFVVIIIISYIYSTCIYVNDFYSVGALITAAIHADDTYSDILFMISITNQPEYEGLLGKICFYACITFIVFPVILTMYQVYHEINKWSKNEVLAQWIKENSTLLYIVSVITGSSFSGVQICTSNLFNMDQFDMPLNEEDLNKFQVQKMWSLVLVENIPQLAIQIVSILLFEESRNEIIIYVAMTFSLLSVFISTLSLCSKRNIQRVIVSVAIEFDVKGLYDNVRQCRNRVKVLKSKFAESYGVDEHLLEILRPKPIPDGLKVTIYRKFNAKQIDLNEIEVRLNDMYRSDKLSVICKSSWNLSKKPFIENIRYFDPVSEQWMCR